MVTSGRLRQKGVNVAIVSHLLLFSSFLDRRGESKYSIAYQFTTY